ncbi:hypothetical protein [Adhaeribacter radiodurans]|uniref:Lipoprotein n=1 Tax=Adhaeribacter radiodurans TaxID=2745197 RepID=A0A7L7LDV9_9BACT|nr:hypothetical protein [Adhaeribacter radiodurans]QMU31000.1 hypothetical protein HUW48_24560 [Adhaeribacter radiodurans]
MKKLLLLAGVISLMAFSCEKEEPECGTSACGVTEPLQNLPWLKAEVESLEKNSSDISEYLYIVQANYKGETVFFTGTCCPYCNTAPPTVFNCKGQELFTLGQNAKQDNSIKNKKVIWKGPNYACTL